MPDKKDSEDLATPLQVRDAFLVKRFHTIHLTIPETVGHHTCNVISILFYLYEDNPPVKVIHQALHHDVPELYTGDIPATAKWRFPLLNKAVMEAERVVAKELGLAYYQLSEIDNTLIHFADMVDLCFKCIEEIAVGNAPFGEILSNGMSYCKKLLDSNLKDHKRANRIFQVLFEHPHVHIEQIQLKAVTLQ